MGIPLLHMAIPLIGVLMIYKQKTSTFQIKHIEENGIFSGYASVFDCIYFKNDQVLPGAFKKSLQTWRAKNDWPKMLWQHNHHHPIGVWLDMTEDDIGLLVKGQLLLDVQKGKEAYALLKRGIVSGLSIGFSLSKASPSIKGHQLLEEIELHEISLVTFAANPKSKVEWVKSRKINLITQSKIENRLTPIIEKLLEKISR